MHSESQARSPGRPLGFDRTAAVDELLVLFLERGYDQVSQQQMAAATGLSTSSLYNTFGTKPELFRAVMQRFIERCADLLAPLEHGDRGVEDLLEFLRRYEAQMDSPLGRRGCLVTSSMITMVGRDPELDVMTSEYRARLRAGFAATLQRARDLGEPVPDPAATAPLLVAATLGNLATARATTAGPETYEQLAALTEFVRSWRNPADDAAL